MNKQFIAVVLLVIAAFFGVFYLTSKSSTNNSTESTGKPSEHIAGEGKKNVTLIEYGDLECPACKSYYPIAKQIKEDYKDDITFQFRHFPLVQLHPHAFQAARAAEAAGNQNKFFEMHDLMYENQESWSSSSDVSPIFEGFAQSLGLDMNKFKADVISETTASIINADLKAGQALGVNSTPSFILNGKKLEENPKSLEEFKKLIDEAIAASSNGQ